MHIETNELAWSLAAFLLRVVGVFLMIGCVGQIGVNDVGAIVSLLFGVFSFFLASSISSKLLAVRTHNVLCDLLAEVRGESDE